MAASVYGDRIFQHPHAGIVAAAIGSDGSIQRLSHLAHGKGTQQRARLKSPHLGIELRGSDSRRSWTAPGVDAKLLQQRIPFDRSQVDDVALTVSPDLELVDHVRREHVRILDIPLPGGIGVVVA